MQTSSLRLPARLMAVLAGLVLAPSPLPAQNVSPSTGAIQGRVQNVTLGEYLNNARVVIDGTSLEAFTNAFGEYRLGNIPAGRVTVRVFYTGLEAQSAEINVTPGKTETQDFKLRPSGAAEGDPLQLEQFVVLASREMTAAAIAVNEQRFAANIKNVVSADQFGDVTEGNIGEFLKFLPGVTIGYVAADARTVSVRGMPPASTPVTVDGHRMASAASSGATRVFEFEQVSINNVSRIEVIKTPTPDQPSDTLGGSVNMISKRAFEVVRPQFKYRGYLSLNDEEFTLKKTPGPGRGREYKARPGFDFSYLHPVSDRFGFSIQGLYSEQYNPQYTLGMDWVPHAEGVEGIPAGNPYLYDYGFRDDRKSTTRSSIAGTADWRIGSHGILSVGLQHNTYESFPATKNIGFEIGDDPVAWGPTFTHGGEGEGAVTRDAPYRLKSGATTMLTLGYEHRGPVWKIDAGASYSQGTNRYRDLDNGHVAQLQLEISDVTINFDDIGEHGPRRITVLDEEGDPIDPFALDSYEIAGATSSDRHAVDTYRTAHLDITRDLDFAVPTTLKAGVSVRQNRRDRVRDNVNWNYTGPDSILAELYDPALSQTRPPYGLPRIEWPSLFKAYDFLVANPQYFVPNEVRSITDRVNNSDHIIETVSAAFVRADVRLLENRLLLVGGVRFERTTDAGQGPLNDPSAWRQRDASGNLVRDANGNPIAITNDPVQRARLQYTERGTRVKNTYSDYYPSLNATYKISDDFLVRASYARTLGRPDYSNILPGTTITDPGSSTRRITVRNTALKPWEADNFDVSLEYYLEPSGVFSIAGFRKNLSNFFGTLNTRATPELLDQYGLDDEYLDYEWRTVTNVGDARITGVEVNYAQSLTFLPSWARGIQVFANGTSMRLEGSHRADFEEFVPKHYNFGVSLSRSRFDVKLNWNYRGRQRVEAVEDDGVPPGVFEYLAPRLYLDVNAEFRLNRWATIFLNARNITNEPQDTEVYGPSTPGFARLSGRDEFGVQYVLGVKGRF